MQTKVTTTTKKMQNKRKTNINQVAKNGVGDSFHTQAFIEKT
jgi:hypothetical protein